MDLDKTRSVQGHKLRLRLVQSEDADYIYDLRMNPDYNSYLSAISGTVADQARWIEGYKTREAMGSELYYIIERLDGPRCGVVRLYEITEQTFTWGSWVLDHNKPAKAALECALLIYRIGLDLLECPKAVFEVLNENAQTLAFHRRMGAIEIDSDAQNTYFELTNEGLNTHKTALWAVVENQANTVDR